MKQDMRQDTAQDSEATVRLAKGKNVRNLRLHVQGWSSPQVTIVCKSVTSNKPIPIVTNCAQQGGGEPAFLLAHFRMHGGAAPASEPRLLYIERSCCGQGQ